MVQQNKKISLEGKMDNWGPFGNNEGNWLIFSIGNPEEGHGYALPRNIDDLFSQRVAHLISCKSGGRYVAHIPWATDNFKSAVDWAPRVISVSQLAANIKKFIQFHIKIYEEMGLPASKVLIFSGHGGNNPLTKYAEEIKKDLNLEKLIISTTEGLAEDNMIEILKALEDLSAKLATRDGSDPKKLKRTLIKILTGAGHACHFEHSAGAAIGVLDEEKLRIMNEELEQDFEKALEKYPPVAGLGGYLLAGGKYVEEIGTKETDTHGLWNCLKTVRTLDGGKIKVVKELGELVIELLSDYYAKMMLEQ